MMHNGMQYDPVQVQGQGHEPFKFGNSAVLKSYLLLHLQWQLAADHGFLNKAQYLNLIDPDFWYSV